MNEQWTDKDNLTAVIGIITSLIPAVVYEWATLSMLMMKELSM